MMLETFEKIINKKTLDETDFKTINGIRDKDELIKELGEKSSKENIKLIFSIKNIHKKCKDLTMLNLMINSDYINLFEQFCKKCIWDEASIKRNITETMSSIEKFTLLSFDEKFINSVIKLKYREIFDNIISANAEPWIDFLLSLEFKGKDITELFYSLPKNKEKYIIDCFIGFHKNIKENNIKVYGMLDKEYYKTIFTQPDYFNSHFSIVAPESVKDFFRSLCFLNMISNKQRELSLSQFTYDNLQNILLNIQVLQKNKSLNNYEKILKLLFSLDPSSIIGKNEEDLFKIYERESTILEVEDFFKKHSNADILKKNFEAIDKEGVYGFLKKIQTFALNNDYRKALVIFFQKDPLRYFNQEAAVLKDFYFKESSKKELPKKLCSLLLVEKYWCEDAFKNFRSIEDINEYALYDLAPIQVRRLEELKKIKQCFASEIFSDEKVQRVVLCHPESLQSLEEGLNNIIQLKNDTVIDYKHYQLIILSEPSCAKILGKIIQAFSSNKKLDISEINKFLTALQKIIKNRGCRIRLLNKFENAVIVDFNIVDLNDLKICIFLLNYYNDKINLSCIFDSILKIIDSLKDGSNIEIISGLRSISLLTSDVVNESFNQVSPEIFRRYVNNIFMLHISHGLDLRESFNFFLSRDPEEVLDKNLEQLIILLEEDNRNFISKSAEDMPIEPTNTVVPSSVEETRPVELAKKYGERKPWYKRPSSILLLTSIVLVALLAKFVSLLILAFVASFCLIGNVIVLYRERKKNSDSPTDEIKGIKPLQEDKYNFGFGSYHNHKNNGTLIINENNEEKENSTEAKKFHL